MICGVMCVCRTTFKFVPKLIHKKGREWEGYRFVVLRTGEERGRETKKCKIFLKICVFLLL